MRAAFFTEILFKFLHCFLVQLGINAASLFILVIAHTVHGLSWTNFLTGYLDV